MRKENNLYSGFYLILGSINTNKNLERDIENKINYVESIIISRNLDIHLVGFSISNNCFKLLIHSSQNQKTVKQIIFDNTEYYLQLIYPKTFRSLNKIQWKRKYIRKISNHRDLLNLASSMYKQNSLNIAA